MWEHVVGLYRHHVVEKGGGHVVCSGGVVKNGVRVGGSGGVV